MSGLHILLLGETTIGNVSLTDLIVGQEGTSHSKVHAVEIDGKAFHLYAVSPSDSIGGTTSSTTAGRTLPPILTDFGKTGGLHIVMYSFDASLPAFEQQQSHTTACARLPSGLPVVAIVTGLEDAASLELWWSANEPLFSPRGVTSFVDHACIPVMSKGSLSPMKDQAIRSQGVLRALILKHSVEAVSSSEHGSLPESKLSKPSRPNSFAQLSVKGSFRTLRRRYFGGTAVEMSQVSIVRGEERANNVVVLGEVGVGKSSVINLILGSAVAGVSSDSEPFTRESAEYTFHVKGKTFHIYDTEGLQDPQMGLDGYLGPIEKAYKLIQNLEKVDLMLFCVRNGRPTTALRSNYALFYEVICQRKVPLALVATHQEHARKMEQWWKAHSGTLSAYGIECAGHACVSSLPDESNKITNRYEESREALLSLLLTCVDKRKFTVKGVFSSARRIGLTRDIMVARSRDERVLDTLVRRCELEEDIAQELATCLVNWRSPTT